MKTWMKSVVSAIMLSMGVLIAGVAAQNNIARDYRDSDQNDDQGANNRYDQPLIDRYLDVQVWTDHRDGEYYDGDNIVISFMANRDAFVVIYSIDTKGRVDMLFPADPGDDNFVTGGVTYRLPSKNSNYDLKVTGPEGTENIQVIASRERIAIPDWYPNSGVTTDEDDRSDFMEYVNSRYFVRYDGQRFAYDRANIYVDEWEPVYYRPVYYPDYPSWSVCGNVYIDYPYGGTVYINGIYWGCAPLYIPRILCGWQTVTIYDPYGYCWENDIHISRYRTVVLNRTIIHTEPNVVSKYKEVRYSGYKNPANSGYPEFTTKQKAAIGSSNVTKSGITKDRFVPTEKDANTSDDFMLPKKHLYGDGAVTKTDRGYETPGGAPSNYERKQFGQKRETSTYRSGGSYQGKSYTPDYTPSQSGGNNNQPGYGGGKQKSGNGSDGNFKAAPKKKGSSDNGSNTQAQPAQPQKETPKSKADDGNKSQPKFQPKSDGGGSKGTSGAHHGGKGKP